MNCHAIQSNSHWNENRTIKIEGCGTQIPGDPLEFAQRGGNGQTGGTDGRHEAPDYAHDQREKYALQQKIWCDFERKRDIRKCLEIHRAGGEPVKRQNNQAAEDSADQRNEQRLNQE